MEENRIITNERRGKIDGNALERRRQGREGKTVERNREWEILL